MKLNVRADWGFSNKAIDYRPILNGEDRRDILYMGLKNYALNSGKDETYAVNYADNNIDKYAAKPWSGYTDWEDVLFRNGSHQNYEVNAKEEMSGLSFILHSDILTGRYYTSVRLRAYYGTCKYEP